MHYHSDCFKIKDTANLEDFSDEKNQGLVVSKDVDGTIDVSFPQPPLDIEELVQKLQAIVADDEVAVLVSNMLPDFHSEVILITSTSYARFTASADDIKREEQIRRHPLWKMKGK